MMNVTSEFYPRDRSIQPPELTPRYKTTVLRSPRIPLWPRQASLSEMTGPTLVRQDLGPLDNDLARNYPTMGDFS